MKIAALAGGVGGERFLRGLRDALDADPDLAVPGRTASGQPILSDFGDAFKYDEALQAHVVGLRFPVLPRFTLKAEYNFVREDGGRTNRLFNDAFGFQAVADF